MEVFRSEHASDSKAKVKSCFCVTGWTQTWWWSQQKNNNSVDFYYYSKYDWSVISCTNTEPIDRNTTGLNWTELYWKSRRKSKQNLSVSLSPEVWQKCFVAALSWPTSFTSCRSVIASDLDPPIHWTDQWQGSSAGLIGSFLKADWSFSS